MAALALADVVTVSYLYGRPPHDVYVAALMDAVASHTTGDNDVILNNFACEQRTAIILYEGLLAKLYRGSANFDPEKFCEENPDRPLHYLVAEFLCNLSTKLLEFSASPDIKPIVAVGLVFLSAFAIDNRVELNEDNIQFREDCVGADVDGPMNCAADEFRTALCERLSNILYCLHGDLYLSIEYTEWSTIIENVWCDVVTSLQRCRMWDW
jgi:hypothetical protein